MSSALKFLVLHPALSGADVPEGIGASALPLLARAMGQPESIVLPGHGASTSPFLERRAAAALVAELNPAYPAPPPGIRYVVAGQQPGLLTGPLYTVLKAASAVSLAARISREQGAEVIPLFWIASEDHDVLEVNRVTLGGRTFVHPPPGEIRRGRMPPVGALPLSGARAGLLAFLRGVLPETEYTPRILEAVAAADFTSYATAFRDLMAFLFEGLDLRFVTPEALRSLSAPLLAALVEQWPRLRAALAEGTDRLRDLGIEPPLKGLRLFEIRDGCRQPLEETGEGFRFPEGTLSFAAVAERIRERPADFSPGAALRPLLQDGVLPVAAMTAGPSEFAYLAQIHPLYAAAGMIPSLRVPRVRVTFVEPAVRRAAERAGLSRERILEARRALELLEAAPGRSAAADAAEERWRAFREVLAQAGGEPPPRWLVRGRETLESQAKRLLQRLREESDGERKIRKQRLLRVAEALTPKGALQERVENVFSFWNRYGPDFVRLAVERIDPLDGAHRLVFIEKGAAEEGVPAGKQDEG